VLTEMFLGDAAFLCLGCGVGCWLAGVKLPRGPVAAITAMAAFVTATLVILAAEVWMKSGAGEAWPLLLIAALCVSMTFVGLVTGKRRGWD
jgi:hypothetical protein